MHQFYDDSLRRIEELEEYDKDFALRVLSFVFYARRPLSRDELIHALSVESGATDLDSDALYPKVLLFSASSGLIRVDDKSSSVHLAHHTLYEHLDRFCQRQLMDREGELATACLTYLLFEPFRTGPCDTVADMVGRLSHYSLLEYACQYWPSHATKFMDGEVKTLALSLLSEKSRVATCAQLLHLPRHRVGEWHKKYPCDFTCLHAAAYWGLDKAVVLSLKTGVDVDCQDSNGATPLLLAAEYGHTETATLLLDATSDVDFCNNLGETALTLAARYGHEAIVRLLLERGANSLAEDVEGWTALHWAIMRRHDNISKILLSRIASNQSDKVQHNKALVLAAEAGNPATIQMLLDEGAEVDYTDDQDSTPLHWAVPLGHIEAARVLLSRGANPGSRDRYDHTPMHWAVPYHAIARLLANYGADVRATNRTGQSALLWAALAGMTETVETLIQLGAEIDGCDRYNFTALHAAALQGHIAIVRILLREGASADKRDMDGWTALDAAVLTGRSDVIDLLISPTDNGRDIATQAANRLNDVDMRSLMEEMAARKSVGSTVVSGLRSAINSEHDLRLRELLASVAQADIDAEDELCGSTALTYAAWFGKEEIVRLLLDHGADVDLRERSGRTALHWAAWSGYPDMVADLVERGATIDMRVFGWTAMLLAARTWQHRIVLYLVEHGANVSAKDFHGRTALHWSCIHGDIYLAEELIRLGANVDDRDHCGQTALQWAVAGRHYSIASMLLRRNAKARLQASDGSSALHLAAYTGQPDVATLLLNWEQRQEGRRAGWENTCVACVDSDSFTALDMAKLTGNLHVAEILSRQYTNGHTHNDSHSLITNGQWAGGSRTQGQLRAPPLDIAKEEEDDYVSADNFADGLGRRLIGRQARQWLRERQMSASLSSPSTGSAFGISNVPGPVQHTDSGSRPSS